MDSPAHDTGRPAQPLAFEQVYRQYAPGVGVYFRRSGFPPADADDLVQETFINVLRSLATFDPGRGTLGTWLAAIARNVARKRWQRRVDAGVMDAELADAALAAPADQAASREELSAVGQCVEALPPDLRRLVRLRYVDGLTTRAIAQEAGLPEATVRLRLAEAVGVIETGLRDKGIAS
jgi:RNA polymerase sigma-70 factor (ECF subfamily)